MALAKSRSFGEASRHWDEAIKKEPYNAKYYRLAGECMEKAGMTIRARRMYESALKWNPDDAGLMEALGRVGGGTGQKKGFLSNLFRKSRT